MYHISNPSGRQWCLGCEGLSALIDTFDNNWFHKEDLPGTEHCERRHHSGTYALASGLKQPTVRKQLFTYLLL